MRPRKPPGPGTRGYRDAGERGTPGGIQTPGSGRHPGGGLSGLPGTVNPATGRVVMPFDAAKPKKVAPIKETLRRQRLLRAFGYKIVADGIWGPRSQKAWVDYIQRQRHGQRSPLTHLEPSHRLPVAATGEKTPKGLVDPNAVTPQEARAAQAKHDAEIVREARKVEAHRRAVLMERAHKLAADVSLAATMPFHRLAMIVQDREAGMEYGKTKIGTRAVQIWLNHHGFKHVKATGEVDDVTHKALHVATARAERRAVARRAHFIVQDLYQPAGVKVGDKPPWLPLPGGIPAPKQMDKLIQGGGFTAQAVMKALIGHALVESGMSLPSDPFHSVGPAAYDQWRNNELMKLASKFDPLSAFTHPDGEPNPLWDYATILGQTDLMPKADLRAQVLEAYRDGDISEDEYKQLQIQNETYKNLNVAKVRNLRANAQALMLSTDREDFNRRLLVLNKKSEDEFTARQKQMMTHFQPGWMKAIGALAWPVHHVEQALYMGQSFIAPPIPTSTQGARQGERLTWEESETFRQEMAKQHPIYNFILDLTVDPLNFARPIRVGSTALVVIMSADARFAERAAKLGSYRLVKGASVFDHSWKYDGATWSKSGVLDSIARPFAGTHAEQLYDKALREGAKWTQLRRVAVYRAGQRVAIAARHGFKTPKDATAARSMKVKQAAPEDRELIDKSITTLKAEFQTEGHYMQPIIDGYVEDAASMYVTSDRSVLSQVGAAFHANGVEKARVTTVHHIAGESAQDVFDAQAATTQAGREAARVLRNQEYASVVEDAGVYIVGGASNNKEMVAQISARTFDRADELEFIIIPAIQEIIEARLEALGITLWDKAGLWIGRKGEAATALKRMAAESFDEEATDTIKNPQFGHGYSQEDFISLRDWELKRRLPRVYQYEARHTIAGDLPEGFDVGEKVQEITDEITAAWEKREDGLYYDKRPTVEVSRLYNRQNVSAYERLSEGAAALLRGDAEKAFNLDDLSATPFISADSDIDNAMWQLMWGLGARFKLGGAAKELSHPTRALSKPPLPEHPQGLTPEALGNIVNAETASRERVAQAVAGAKLGLSRAQTHALPRELVRERALLAALQKQQRWYYKAIYTALVGTMTVWRFLTLPLRPGWVIRNQIDNTAKALIQGVHDVRYFFAGAAHPGARARSVFDADLSTLRSACRFLDTLMGDQGKAIGAFDEIIDRIWTIENDVLNRLFKTHGMVPVPEAALEGTRGIIGHDAGMFRVHSTISVKASDYRTLGYSASDPTVPKHIREALNRDDAVTEYIRRGMTREEAAKRVDEEFQGNAAQRLARKIAKTPDVMWTLMADMPENYMKRVIFRSTYDKSLKRHLADGVEQAEAETLAYEEAWDLVTETLFDYNQISVIEDNLKIFLPFVQFWRKNTVFWMKQFGNKPWLSLALLKFDDARENAQADLPAWARRYIRTDEIVDAAAVVPGLDKLVDQLLPDDYALDPLSLSSFSPLHAVWRNLAYGENPTLPGERPGLPIIGPMLDAMNDWGLSMSPLVRKPLEWAGVASERSWQFMFPQTAPLMALTREFFSEDAALKVASWERVFNALPFGVKPDDLADNFEYYVQVELAHQALNGETPNRKVAEGTVKADFWLKNLWGYFGGVYFRNMSEEDVFLMKLTAGQGPDREDLTPEQQEAAKLWAMRGIDKLSMDRYLTMRPLIQAYYLLDTPAEKGALTQEHPELRRYVGAEYRGKPWKANGQWIKNVMRYTETSKFFRAIEVLDHVDAPHDVRDAALDVFATPQLRRYWAANDTPAETRHKQIKGEVHRHLRQLNAQYFSIPENDFEARDAFAAENPEMIRGWNRNNDHVDDLSAVQQSGNAALREQYFDIIESYEDENKGFKAAEGFLMAHKFMFDDTDASKNFDAKTGKWKFTWKSAKKKGWSREKFDLYVKAQPHLNWFFDTYLKSVGEDRAYKWLQQAAAAKNPRAMLIREYLNKYSQGDPNWSAEHKKAYLEAKPHLIWFFDTFMPKVGEKKAWDWLETSDSQPAKILSDYFKKYGKAAQKQIDFLKVKPWLTRYWGMDAHSRAGWLAGGSAEAKLVIDWNKKYGSDRGIFAQALAYSTAKPLLDRYFAMDKEARRAWLANGTADSGIVLDYFKRFGKQAMWERAFLKKHPEYQNGTPEQRRRLLFWQQFYSLPADERPSYVLKEAENHGVFIYGTFGEAELHDQQMEEDRRAVGLKLSDRQQAYLDVRPLLRFFQTLNKDDKPLFLRANPDLQTYFDKYGAKSITGDAKLDKLVEAYFKLPGDSFLRSDFLKKHPDVQDWFDARATPAERAMRNVLEQYFAIPSGDERKSFVEMHPEIPAYFEARRQERANAAIQYGAFDQANPDFIPFYKSAADLERGAAAMRARLHRMALHAVSGIGDSRSRQPLTR